GCGAPFSVPGHHPPGRPWTAGRPPGGASRQVSRADVKNADSATAARAAPWAGRRRSRPGRGPAAACGAPPPGRPEAGSTGVIDEDLRPLLESRLVAGTFDPDVVQALARRGGTQRGGGNRPGLGAMWRGAAI